MSFNTSYDSLVDFQPCVAHARQQYQGNSLAKAFELEVGYTSQQGSFRKDRRIHQPEHHWRDAALHETFGERTDELVQYMMADGVATFTVASYYLEKRFRTHGRAVWPEWPGYTTTVTSNGSSASETNATARGWTEAKTPMEPVRPVMLRLRTVDGGSCERLVLDRPAPPSSDRQPTTTRCYILQSLVEDLCEEAGWPVPTDQFGFDISLGGFVCPIELYIVKKFRGFRGVSLELNERFALSTELQLLRRGGDSPSVGLPAVAETSDSDEEVVVVQVAQSPDAAASSSALDYDSDLGY